MGSFTKQEILDAIRQTAKQNDGKPLGRTGLKKETGIGVYDWGAYWAKFSDAQQEAGFTPNLPNTAYEDEFLIEKMIGKIRHYGKYPTLGELRVELNKDADFPFRAIKQRTQKELVIKIVEYCNKKTGYDDVINICKPIIEKLDNQEQSEDTKGNEKIGEVYLAKSGNYYKIGKTKDSVRRGQELKIQLAEELKLIHLIKTDDPSGIEAYWHNRFEAKRKRGEWFDLRSADVKAFKRWKRIA